MTSPRTSASHPIRVDWLPLPWLGKVGLTFAPGKHQPDALTGAWARDLTADLVRLREHFGVDHLVCLLEDAELRELRIEALPEGARAIGLTLHRLPIADGTVPADDRGAAELVSDIVAWAAAGESVVLHCKGGLGRAGTIGGCVLRSAGLSGPSALAALAQARGPSCPETAAQRIYIEAFEPPPPATLSRVQGCVLGAAVGDALGHPTEFLSADGILERYGSKGVTGFEKWWDAGGKRFAPYTDDTQMAEIVLRALISAKQHQSPMDSAMVHMAEDFGKWAVEPQGGHRAPGNACLSGANRIAQGIHWREAGGPTAGGCGSVMRAYPFGLLLGDDLEAAEHWAVEHSRMSHQDPIALAACAALAVGVALELRGSPEKLVFERMIEAAGRWDPKTARMAEEAVGSAREGADPRLVLKTLEGWAAHEAIAAAMFVVARHPRDIAAALLEGANAHGDSDSIATLAGALLGARLGLQALPAHWVRDVERSDELLALGRDAAELAHSNG